MTPHQAQVCVKKNAKSGLLIRNHKNRDNKSTGSHHDATPAQVCAKKNAKSGLLIRNHKNRENKSTGSHHDATPRSGLCEEKRKIRSAHKKSQKQRQKVNSWFTT